MSAAFIGVDLGWSGKPTGLASITGDSARLTLRNETRIEGAEQIFEWIVKESGCADSVVAVDAPLVIPNKTGMRDAERGLNRDFHRAHAGCHSSNQSRPFANNVVAFSRGLAARGFRHGCAMEPRERGRFQIEVYPHPAVVNLFALDRIVKYKRGRRAERGRELRRLRMLMLSRLPGLDPPLELTLPEVPEAGALKPVEDRLDAVLCAYIAAHWWFWGCERNTAYGTKETGYIIVPNPEAGNGRMSTL